MTTNIAPKDLMQAMGQRARAASALMAKASPAAKSKALKTLAALLRAQTTALQPENEKDLAAAREDIVGAVRDKFQIMIEQEPLEL